VKLCDLGVFVVVKIIRIMSRFHLLCGPCGAGKTSYAIKLADELSAVRFSSDEWIKKLYDDSLSSEMFTAYQTSVRNLAWDYALRIADLGIDSIMDFGFWTRKGRDKARQLITDHGHSYVLYYVTAPQYIRKQRVLRRSQEEDQLKIDEAAFDKFEHMFESPDDDECSQFINTGE
jgi:predicted kinase